MNPSGERGTSDIRGFVQQSRAMTEGWLTSEALSLYFLVSIRDHDDDLRSYIELNPAALTEARRADTLCAAGDVLSPLHGITVSIKDNIETTPPMHTTIGTETLLDNLAAADAPLVGQLRSGGAVILGKASLSELAGTLTFGMLLGASSAVAGQSFAPYGLFPTAGSSEGSAEALPTRLMLLSVGTETSGSLIGPAAWNGVVATKPSRGVVEGTGVVPLVSINDSAGPMARTVADAAALLSVMDTTGTNYVAAPTPTPFAAVASTFCGRRSSTIRSIATFWPGQKPV